MAIKNKLEVFKHYLVLDQSDLLPDRVTMTIDSMDAFDNQLYIGTNEGMLLLYRIEDLKGRMGTLDQGGVTRKSGDERHFKAQLLHKNLFDLQEPRQKGATRRGHVTHIKVAPQINRAFVVLEGNLLVVHSQNLELRDLGQTRVKNVISFCINEHHQQTPLETCVGTKNRISFYNFSLHPDQLLNTRDIALNNENPQSIALDASTICAALVSGDMKTGRYALIQTHLNPAVFQELCTIPKVQYPFVKRARNGNFFLNVGLCQFTSTIGESKHVPILWEKNIRSAVFAFPYLVCANSSQVFVYSMLNQQEKQDFNFKDHHALCTTTRGDELRVLLASERSVYCLKSTGLQYQAEYLLDSRQIEEALQLAKVEHAFLKSRSTQATADSYLVKVKQRVGLLYLQGGHYHSACQQLLDGQMDPREVISLIPGLLLKGSSYDIVHKDCEIVKGRMIQESDPEKILKFKNFLITYLDAVRTEPVAVNLKEEIDTAMLGLLAQLHSADLIPFIETRTTISYEDGVSILTREKCFYALGIFYSFNREIEKALQTWIQIENGECEDKSFPGFGFLIEYLSNLGYHELVMKFAKWALERDELKAVNIFTKRPDDETPSEVLSHDCILKLLMDFPFARKEYMSYIVAERNVDDTKLHTDYALILLQDLLSTQKQRKPNPEDIFRCRKDFTTFLNFSKYYDPLPIQSEVTKTEFYPEMSILFGRMGEHEKALEILVYKFRDINKALEYCSQHSLGKSRNIRQDIHGKLLKVFLEPKDGSRPQYEEALLLLNNPNVDINTRTALTLLPDDWSIKKLSLFLQRSLKRHSHYYRTTSIEQNLAKWEHIRVKRHLINEEYKRVVITENVECQICKQAIGDSTFVRYPNSVIIHMQCMKNKNICPVTGTWFGGIS